MEFGIIVPYVVTFLILLNSKGDAKVIKSSKVKGNTNTRIYGGESTTVMGNLSTSLFTDYDHTIRPYCQGEETVNVTIDMAIRQLLELDEPNQVVRMNIWMRLSWQDCQLGWEPDDFDGIKELTVPYSKLWVPDLALHERISDEFYGLENFRPTIYEDGTVNYNFPSTIETLCPIDVTNFPFDTQTCLLTFGSWAYHGFNINVTSKSNTADLSNLKSNVEWVITKATAERHENYYNGFSEPYPDVTFVIYLKRKPMYYVTNMIIPAILITCVTTLAFILPVDSGEKVGLNLTVMLTISVFQLLIADKLPPSSEKTPWIAVYFTFTLALTGVSAMFQVFVINLHHRENEHMSQWLAFKVLQPLATITLTDVQGFKPFRCISKQPEYVTEGNSIPEDSFMCNQPEDVKEENSIPDYSMLWKLLAKCVDRLCLGIFLLTFTVGTTLIFVKMLDSLST